MFVLSNDFGDYLSDGEARPPIALRCLSIPAESLVGMSWPLAAALENRA